MFDSNGGNPGRPAYTMLIDPNSDDFIGGHVETSHAGPISVTSGSDYTRVHVKTTPETSVYSQERIDEYIQTSTHTWIARMLDGEFIGDEGLVYRDFSEATHVKSVTPDPGWTYYRGIDFGYTNPSVCLVVAVDADSRVYVLDEIYERNLTISDFADRIAKQEKSLKVEITYTYADPSGAGSIAELYRHGIMCVRAKNEIALRLGKIRDLLRIRGDGRPGLLVDARCVATIKEFLSYELDPVASRIVDKPYKVNDHAMDALGYVIATCLQLRDSVE
jgi:phage terminase large subunit